MTERTASAESRLQTSKGMRPLVKVRVMPAAVRRYRTQRGDEYPEVKWNRADAPLWNLFCMICIGCIEALNFYSHFFFRTDERKSREIERNAAATRRGCALVPSLRKGGWIAAGKTGGSVKLNPSVSLTLTTSPNKVRGGSMPFVIITPQGKSRLSAAGLNLPTLWLKRKDERRALFCCDCAPRGKPNTKPQATVGFS